MADMYTSFRPWEMIQGGFGQLGDAALQGIRGYQNEQRLNSPLSPEMQAIVDQALGRQMQQQIGPQIQQAQPPTAPMYGPLVGGLAQPDQTPSIPNISLNELTSQPQQPEPPQLPQMAGSGRMGPFAWAANPPATRGVPPGIARPPEQPARQEQTAPPPPPVQPLQLTNLGGRSRPMTMRDLQAIEPLIPLLQSRLATERSSAWLLSKKEIAEMLEGGRATRASERAAVSRESIDQRRDAVAAQLGISRERLDEAIRQHDIQNGIAARRLDVLAKALNQKVDDKTWQSLAKELGDIEDEHGRVSVSGLQISDPRVAADLEKNRARIDELRTKLDQKRREQAATPTSAQPTAGARPPAGRPSLYPPGYEPKK